MSRRLYFGLSRNISYFHFTYFSFPHFINDFFFFSEFFIFFLGGGKGGFFLPFFSVIRADPIQFLSTLDGCHDLDSVRGKISMEN